MMWNHTKLENLPHNIYVGPRIPDMYPLHERGNTTTLYYNSNNSAMFLAREK